MITSAPAPTIISTDPGIDDAVAIAIALGSPLMDVQLICPIAGNVSVEKTTLNTRLLLTFLNQSPRIVQGSRKPLLRPLKDASGVHGKTGMDGYPFPEPNVPVDTVTSAAVAMHETVMTNSQPVTLIGIGPLTDIALFIHQYPDDLKKIKQLVLMGCTDGSRETSKNLAGNLGKDQAFGKSW